MMGELFLPVLSHFQNQNTWISSQGRLRYKVVPDGEELKSEVWEGPWEYALSTVEGAGTFSMSEEGLGSLAAWLEGWAADVNARPRRTLEEDIERREAVKREKEAQAAQQQG